MDTGMSQDGDGSTAPSLDTLAQLMERLNGSPYDYSLHLEHIASAKRLTRAQGRLEALDKARRDLAQRFCLTESLWDEWLEDERESTGYRDLLKQALTERPLSPLLWKRALDFYSQGQGSDDVDAFRKVAEEANLTMGYHLVDSDQVWQLIFDHELALLAQGRSDVARLLGLFIKRLHVPHLQLDATWQKFSAFVSEYRPDDYENIMAANSKHVASTKKVIAGRQVQEDLLASASYSVEAYEVYLDWEESRTHLSNLTLTKTLYERALNHHPFDSGIWSRYLYFTHDRLAHRDLVLPLVQRSLRSCPWSGQVVAFAIAAYDAHGDFAQAEQVYDQALAQGLVTKRLDDFVPVCMAAAALQAHTIDWDQIDDREDEWRRTIKVLLDGFKLIKSNGLGKDPLFQMNRYLAHLYERAGDFEMAMHQWELILKQYKESHLAIIGTANFMARFDLADKVQQILEDGVAERNCDWPEQVMAALERFEVEQGTASSQIRARGLILKRSRALALQRAKQQEAYEAAVSHQAESSSAGVGAGAALSNGTKRSLEDDAPPQLAQPVQDSKKARSAQEPLKRDREHSTVYVRSLPASTTEAEIEELFRDCGPVREIKQFESGGVPSALVELMDRADVPAALTKDKKRFKGQEIQVYLAWALTLYVTNFPKEADDDSIRRLFEPFGHIVEIRWPSKRYMDSRRFCYVMFSHPDESNRALALDQTTPLGQESKMHVAISDPSRRAVRSDANAAHREVYMANLAFKCSEEAILAELTKQGFAPKTVRLQRTSDGRSKGFAFLDYETEEQARAVLAMDGHMFMGRRLAVTPVDPHRSAKASSAQSDQNQMVTDQDEGSTNRAARRAAAKESTVKLRKVPSDMQEALLQQALEKKFGPGSVKQVLYTLGENEATVIFTAKKDAGRACVLGSMECGPENKTILIIPAVGQAKAAPKTTVGFVPRSAVKGKG